MGGLDEYRTVFLVVCVFFGMPADRANGRIASKTISYHTSFRPPSMCLLGGGGGVKNSNYNLFVLETTIATDSHTTAYVYTVS